MKRKINEIIKGKKTCYFISPHLDDAAFSATGLISYLAKETKVIVITVFTEAGKDKHSLSGLAYAKMCGYEGSKITNFFSDRRKEDMEAFNNIGTRVIHLGFLDALWRVNEKANIIYKFLSIFLNDFRYVYPTHRLHVAKGKVSKADSKNVLKVERKLKSVVTNDKEYVIFCPLGVGKHVDHILTREVCKKIFSEVIYWEDSPYNLYHQPDQDFIDKNELKKYVFNKNQVVRKEMYPAYKTQFRKLFGGKDFKLPVERYYFRKTK